MEEAQTSSLESGFSSRKKRILMTLKRSGNTSLGEIAKDIGVSKMAALKHLNALEAKGYLERSYKAAGRGRPRVFFQLSQKSTRLFPEAYAHMTTCALAFIEERMGREAVVELLEQRGREIYDKHRGQFQGKDLKGRVVELARIRDEGGYMAQVTAARKDGFELLEHNCPILAVADKYGEACQAETELFRRLLKANVEVSHRVVAGDSVCRFVIKKSPMK